MALRIENADEGATGGSSSVVLFWAHGLRQETVYWGPIGTVEPVDIHWISDSSLSIHYSSGFSDDGYHCSTVRNVHVDCSPRLR